MRIAASPLIVAVALGLLGPSVLEPEDEGQEELGDGGSVAADVTLAPPDAAPVGAEG